jgi:hypothetical protein
MSRKFVENPYREPALALGGGSKRHHPGSMPDDKKTRSFGIIVFLGS